MSKILDAYFDEKLEQLEFSEKEYLKKVSDIANRLDKPTTIEKGEIVSMFGSFTNYLNALRKSDNPLHGVAHQIRQNRKWKYGINARSQEQEDRYVQVENERESMERNYRRM